MRVSSLCHLFLCLVLVVSLCNGDEQTFEVVGIAECADCKQNGFQTSLAFSGLHVTFDCKLKTGEVKRIGTGELDKDGKFRIPLTLKITKDLKDECYAQLHSAAAIPCPTHNGLEATKFVFKSQTNGKKIFSLTKTLQFSSALCTSKFLWPYFKYPPLSKTHYWKKNWPKISFPPLYKPKPKPKPPVVKPFPPPAPTYKPKPPIYKPKPKPPVVKPLPPPAPTYKPPVVTKPLPPPFPLYPIPHFYKKPCPPLPKIPKKYFHHPKFGYFPPLPPFFPQP